LYDDGGGVWRFRASHDVVKRVALYWLAAGRADETSNG
jgi:hypothetical protein